MADPRSWLPCEHRLCAEVAGHLLQQVWREATTHGRALGLAQARAEQLQVFERKHLERLGRAVDRAPTHQQLVERRYPDDGAPALQLRARAERRSARSQAEWAEDVG